MKIEKINLRELNNKELKSTEGGFLSLIILATATYIYKSGSGGKGHSGGGGGGGGGGTW